MPSIRRAADWLRIKNIGALVVTSGKAVLGLISEREIVHVFSRYGESASTPFVNWTEQARSFATAETLEPKDRKAFLRALLYPGRFCYSWMTGFMGSNDDAVAFLAKTRPARLD